MIFSSKINRYFPEMEQCWDSGRERVIEGQREHAPKSYCHLAVRHTHKFQIFLIVFCGWLIGKLKHLNASFESQGECLSVSKCNGT